MTRACTFTSLCPEYEGMFVFDANLPILRNLRAGDGPLAAVPEEHRAILFQEKSYVHSYPHCWRCATPVDLQAGLQLVRVRHQDQGPSA